MTASEQDAAFIEKMRKIEQDFESAFIGLSLIRDKEGRSVLLTGVGPAIKAVHDVLQEAEVAWNGN